MNLLNQGQADKAYCGLGEFQKALTITDEIYQPTETVFGQDSKATFSLRSTVAEICRKTHDYENAEKILKLKKRARLRPLRKFKKVFGKDDIDTLNFMGVLSDNCLLLGNYSDFQKIAEERLSLCQKHFELDTPYTVWCVIDLAKVYYQTGKYKTADKLFAMSEFKNA